MRLLDRAIFFSFCVWLAVDTAFGFLAYASGTDSFRYGSAVFRALVFALLLLRFFTFPRKPYVQVCALFFLSFLLIVHLHLYITDSSNIFESLQTSVKVMLPLLAAATAYALAQDGHLRFSMLEKIVALNSGVLLFNCLLYYAGIGISNYGVTETGIMRGGRGFLFAGNEVAGLLVTLYPLSLLLLPRNWFSAMSIVVLFGLSAVALFSKTALIGYLLFTGVFLWSRYLYLFLPLTAVATTYAVINLDNILRGIRIVELMTERWSYLSGEYGLTVFLLGGYKRLTTAREQLDSLLDSPFSLFVGNGWSGAAENNFVDLVYGYGFLGGLIYLVWLFAFLFPLRDRFRTDQTFDTVFVALTLFLLPVVATLAGHIMQSAMISIFWALLISYNRINYGRPWKPLPERLMAVPYEPIWSNTRPPIIRNG